MSTLSIILKTICWLILLAVTILGAVGHFDSETKKLFFDSEAIKECCKSISECPHNAMDLERVFVAFTIICLILSAVSIVVGLLMKDKVKMIDAGYLGLAGLLLIISGACLLAATIRADKYTRDLLESRRADLPACIRGAVPPITIYPGVVEVVMGELRKEMKYALKLAAGSLGIVDAVLYLVAAAVVAKF